MIHVFHTKISKDVHQYLLDQNLGGFTTDFQQKILRYRKWEDAQQSLLGRKLLQLGLQEIGTPFPPILYSKTGKPYFENSNIKFNISHSNGVVVCAITTLYDLGIDIEAVKKVKITDFDSQMTEGEKFGVISSSNQLEAFYSYWTQKEAVIKAHGAGLSIPLPSFEVISNTTIIDGSRFFLQELQLAESYKCFLAVKNRPNSIVSMHKINVISLLN